MGKQQGRDLMKKMYKVLKRELYLFVDAFSLFVILFGIFSLPYLILKSGLTYKIIKILAMFIFYCFLYIMFKKWKEMSK